MNICIICGKETKNKKFCSVDCKSVFMSKDKGTCLNCGKQLTRCDTKFCSRQCSLTYKKIQFQKNQVLNKCIICGKETKNEKYCSMICLGKDKSRISTAISNLKNTHFWSEEEIQYLNENYGKISLSTISKFLGLDKSVIVAYAHKHNIKSAHKWKEYEVEFLKNNKEKSLDYLCEELGRSKSSISNKYRIINGFNDKNGNKIISPQEYISNFIKSLNIFYLEEVKIGNFSTDILIYNLDIEIQGTYWHCDSRFFDEQNLDDRDIARIDKDQRKKDYFESIGIEILYIWEYDIISNPEKCKQIILHKIKEIQPRVAELKSLKKPGSL